jgi:hypothetical protein
MSDGSNMTTAERNRDEPPEYIQTIMDELRRTSEASKSEARTDLEFDDGSVLVLRSRQGGEVNAHAFEDQEAAGAPGVLRDLPDPA